MNAIAAMRPMKGAVKAALPEPLVRWLKRVRFGDLRRVTPISRMFAYDRGEPIDRYYIDRFLAMHADDVRGHVLEIGDTRYTTQFGGERVTQSDVLHISDSRPPVTMVADLAHAPQIPDDSFDCMIITQTLMFIYDMKAAVATIERVLKPGGVALVTVPGISQIARFDLENWGDYWRLTSPAAQRLFEESFPAECIEIETYGNVLAAIAFLHGLAQHEVTQAELDHRDRDYECVIGIRAKKPMK